MAKPAVIFGGPSDEHDISILTGLQVTRGLGDVHAIYWSKTGDWFEVEPELEAAEFADGVPRRSRELTFVATPGQGLILKKRRLDIDAVVIACHGGPGRTALCKACSTSSVFVTAARVRPPRPWAWTSWPLGRRWRRRACQHWLVP